MVHGEDIDKVFRPDEKVNMAALQMELCDFQGEGAVSSGIAELYSVISCSDYQIPTTGSGMHQSADMVCLNICMQGTLLKVKLCEV